MHDHTTTQGYIDLCVSGKNNPPDPAVIAINDYLKTGDNSYIEQIPRDCGWSSLVNLLALAVGEQLTTPASTAIFEMVVYRIANGDCTQYDRLSGKYTEMCIRNLEPDASEQLLTNLLQSVRDQGCDEFTIALFWITTSSLGYDEAFKWKIPLTVELKLEKPELACKLPSDIAANNVFEHAILGLSDADMVKLLKSYQTAHFEYNRAHWDIGQLQGVLARDRPHVIREFIEPFTNEGAGSEFHQHAIDWRYIVGATDEFDNECVEYCRNNGLAYPLMVLAGLRGVTFHKIALDVCMAYDRDEPHFPMAYLAQHDESLLIEKLTEMIATKAIGKLSDYYRVKYCNIAARNWTSGGKTAYTKVSISEWFDSEEAKDTDKKYDPSFLSTSCEALVKGAVHLESTHPETDQWIQDLLQVCPDDDAHVKYRIRQPIDRYKPYLVEDDLWQRLQSRLKAERDSAANCLNHPSINNVIEKAQSLLADKKHSQLGAIELLTRIGDEAAKQTLLEALKKKQSAEIRRALSDSLEGLGHELTLEELLGDQTAADVLAAIDKAKAKRLPKSAGDWLVIEDLPKLFAQDGSVFSEKVIIELICVQAKHKTISPAPDNLVLFGLIDNDKSGDFALALYQQWLVSSSDAKDKWALTLAGMLGDLRILPALTDPLQGWGEQGRNKLAEYAVLAVALVPGNESLMLLDFLSNRYRSRLRNIGKTCSKALELAAITQKVTMDELEDIIVPTLEFDTDYQRKLPDTEIKALLQPDFKITFLDSATESETKSPPKSLPDTAKSEIKIIKSLITKTVKQQTVRLEKAMVRQRPWTINRWQELFEVNPFLQSYAARLVWATLDEAGKYAKLFRRYPNGLLANADGDLIELDNSDAHIVMAHPLELTEDTIQQWSEHMKRMKIKAPFAQLNRPVAVLDKTHGNRKSIAFTDEHQMPSGTLRSRIEKLGWARSQGGGGASIDAYCKVFTGTGVGAFLLIKHGYVGQNPADNATLGEAVFVKGEPERERNWYTGQPSGADAENVITFGEVPAVVYSETITDLQTVMS